MNKYGELGNGNNTAGNVPVKVNLLCTVTGTEQGNEVEEEINIYPNPASGIFELRISNCQNGGLNSYHILGEKVFQSAIHNSQSEIDLSASPAGIYFVRINTEQGMIAKKIVVQR